MIVTTTAAHFSFILEEIDNAEKRIGSNVNFDATLEVLFLIIRERIQK